MCRGFHVVHVEVDVAFPSDVALDLTSSEAHHTGNGRGKTNR